MWVASYLLKEVLAEISDFLWPIFIKEFLLMATIAAVDYKIRANTLMCFM